MPVSILQKDSPVLRKQSELVPASEFGTPRLLKLIEQMRRALVKCDDGVALAAPQIGSNKRIFIVSGKVLRKEGEEERPEDQAYINPKLIKLSSSKKILDEGCLSVRGVYGKIERSEKASIEAYDVHGKRFVRGASELLAQIFQHEMDHLNGILFIDKAISLENVARSQNLESGI